MISAIVDPSTALRSTLNPEMEQLGELGDRYGCPTYSTVEEMLASATLEGVLVASDHASHFDVCRAAIEHGAHVLCEKPMTTSPQQAWELADMMRSRPDQYFGVNTTANWRRQCVLADDLICNEKRIGNIEHMSCYMGSPLPWLFDNVYRELVPTQRRHARQWFRWGQMSPCRWALPVANLTPTKPSPACAPERSGLTCTTRR